MMPMIEPVPTLAPESGVLLAAAAVAADSVDVESATDADTADDRRGVSVLSGSVTEGVVVVRGATGVVGWMVIVDCGAVDEMVTTLGGGSGDVGVVVTVAWPPPLLPPPLTGDVVGSGFVRVVAAAATSATSGGSADARASVAGSLPLPPAVGRPLPPPAGPPTVTPCRRTSAA